MTATNTIPKHLKQVIAKTFKDGVQFAKPFAKKGKSISSVWGEKKFDTDEGDASTIHNGLRSMDGIFRWRVPRIRKKTGLQN